jgi:hypothetical protein
MMIAAAEMAAMAALHDRAARPFTPRGPTDHCDPEAAIYLCAMCDVEYDLRKTERRRTCPTTTMNTHGTAELQGARFATEGLASSVIIAAAQRSVRESASSISSSAGGATVVGYGDFKRRKHGMDSIAESRT